MDGVSLSTMQFLLYVLATFVSAAFAAGGAYVAVRVKLHYMEKATEENKADIRQLRVEMKTEDDRLHERINRVNERVGAAANSR